MERNYPFCPNETFTAVQISRNKRVRLKLSSDSEASIFIILCS